MSKRTDFDRKWDALEQRFKQAAKNESHEYLPSTKPKRPVNFILVGMEPSLGLWAKPRDIGNNLDKSKLKQLYEVNAKKLIARGFRDYSFSMRDFVFRYAIQKYLCQSEYNYHLTNLSKGAMKINEANDGRKERYEKWWPLIKDEINLIKEFNKHEPFMLIAMGRTVNDTLTRFGITKICGPLQEIINPYNTRTQKRDKLMNEKERLVKFGTYDAPNINEIIKVADRVLKDNGADRNLREERIGKLRKYKELNIPQKKILFLLEEQLSFLNEKVESMG